MVQKTGCTSTQWHELKLYINELKEIGKNEIDSLWPSPDIELNRGSWVWEPYSDDQLFNLAINIYEAAINEYHSLIDIYFKKLKPRMLIATLLPVKMKGYIYFSKSAFGEKTPGLKWYFEPLSRNSKNVVDFLIGENRNSLVVPEDLLTLNQRMRPNSAAWISSFSSFQILDIFDKNPVTNIVYEWLKDDLARINWASSL